MQTPSSYWDVYFSNFTSNLSNSVYAKQLIAQRDKLSAVHGYDNGFYPMSEEDYKTVHNVYRVLFNVPRSQVEVICLGVGRVDTEAEGIYKDVRDLPVWLQEKLAVLNIMQVNPPQTEVEGLGIRIDENTFWVFKE